MADLGEHLLNTELVRDRLSRLAVVTRDHRCLKTLPVERFDGGLGINFDRIGNGDKARERAVPGNRNNGSAQIFMLIKDGEFGVRERNPLLFQEPGAAHQSSRLPGYGAHALARDILEVARVVELASFWVAASTIARASGCSETCSALAAYWSTVASLPGERERQQPSVCPR